MAGGRLVPAAEPAAPAAGAGPEPADPQAPVAVVRIELAGVRAGVLGELAGVRSVHVAGERLVLEAEPGAADAILRQVLADSPVSHVVSVQPGEAAAS